MGQQPFQSQLLHVCSALQLLSSACSRKLYVQYSPQPGYALHSLPCALVSKAEQKAHMAFTQAVIIAPCRNDPSLYLEP